MDDIDYRAVRIETQSPFVLTDVGRSAKRADLVAEYYRPATMAPPFPGVVVCEGLGGVKTARERRYGRFLAQNGAAALVLDSFATRGYGDALHPIRAINVTESMMLADAFAALKWLAAQEEVDEKNIHIIGFSYGGMIAFLTAYEQIARHFAPDGERFASHINYYGPTAPRLEDYRTTGAPVVLLNGELDANVNFKRLDQIAQDLESGGSPVTNRIFENTYHQWDSDDHEKRFDRFNITALRTRITPEYDILNEASGRVVDGFLGRLSMLARSASLKGFHLMRDEDVFAQTDEILLRATGLAREAA